MLPENQHGFRAKRSTMTAWANIQQQWAQNTEKGQITGVMLWDLSAAFDTLDTDILIKKMELYGFSKLTRNWFESFLTNRSQKVKIGSQVSKSVNLNSGGDSFPTALHYLCSGLGRLVGTFICLYVCR